MSKIGDRFKIKQEERNSKTGASVTRYAAVKGPLNDIIRSVAKEHQAKQAEEQVIEPNVNNFERFDWPNYEARGDLEDWEIRRASTTFKYILFLHPQLGPTAVTFSSWQIHADVYQRNFRRYPLISAGFYSVEAVGSDVQVYCSGKSESLDKASRGKDDAIYVKRALGFGD